MSTGSPNARPELVNVLVQHRIDAVGADKHRPRRPPSTEQVPRFAACDCSIRPRVTSYTAFRRFVCECGREWVWRPKDAWRRVA